MFNFGRFASFPKVTYPHNLRSKGGDILHIRNRDIRIRIHILELNVKSNEYLCKFIR